MKNIVDKINEGFFDNMGTSLKFDVSNVCNFSRNGYTQIRWPVDAIEWYVDLLCEAIINTGSKPKTAYAFKDGTEIKVFDKKQVRDVLNKIVKSGKNIETICSVVDAWKEYREKWGQLVNYGTGATADNPVSLNINYAFAMAAMKINKLIDNSIKFKDICNGGKFENDEEVQRYVSACYPKDTSYPFTLKVLSAGAVKADTGSGERGYRQEYIDMLAEVDKLRANIVKLADNDVDVDSKLIKTLDEIKNRVYITQWIIDKKKI